MRKNSGWHVHYQSIISRNSSLIWPIEELHEFSSKRFREEYGVVWETTLAHFVSPLANGRRVEPDIWNDPHEREVLNKTLDDTRVLNRAHKNKMTADILQSVQKLAYLSECLSKRKVRRNLSGSQKQMTAESESVRKPITDLMFEAKGNRAETCRAQSAK